MLVATIGYNTGFKVKKVSTLCFVFSRLTLALNFTNNILGDRDKVELAQLHQEHCLGISDGIGFVEPATLSALLSKLWTQPVISA